MYVRVDDTEVRRLLSHLPEQVGYALSRALNETAWQARQRLVADLPETFTIRNKWTERGINVKKSTKANLVAAVGSTRDYMVAQAEGEVRQERLAVPLVGDGRPRVTIKDTTPPRKWPKSLARRRNVFIGVAGLGWGKGGGTHGVWQRTGKPPVRSREAKTGLRLLYRFPQEVKVKPRWPLKETVEQVVSEVWPEAVTKAVANAIETARR